ncbi:MAG: HAD-IA family hydrolase, partial [Acidimicrobiales bacterium]
AGSDVGAIKPDPACYVEALGRLMLAPDEVVAVEDSPPGCAAAVGAGVACVVVTNSDTAGAEFPGAALVVSGFGGPPLDTVVWDPLGLSPHLPLRASTLAAAGAGGPARPAAGGEARRGAGSAARGEAGEWPGSAARGAAGGWPGSAARGAAGEWPGSAEAKRAGSAAGVATGRADG